MIWEGVLHRIRVMPEIMGHKGEPDHFPDETLRVREPAVPLHVRR